MGREYNTNEDEEGWVKNFGWKARKRLPTRKTKM
jgi:hypothetical protein